MSVMSHSHYLVPLYSHNMLLLSNKDRAIFNLVLKVIRDCIGFALLCSVSGLENFLLFTSISHWLPLIFSFVLIGRCDYFGFGLRHSIEKRSIKQILRRRTKHNVFFWWFFPDIVPRFTSLVTLHWRKNHGHKARSKACNQIDFEVWLFNNLSWTFSQIRSFASRV